MQNSFFKLPLKKDYLYDRLKNLNLFKVGFYSLGLYPASLAYNCVMQGNVDSLLLAPRPGRDIFGAFSKHVLDEMNENILNEIVRLSTHDELGLNIPNSLSYLIEKCDLLVLSSNSNHIERDLRDAIRLRSEVNRQEVVIACLVGSFCHDNLINKSYVLCEKEKNLAFFSGFHRHSDLLNPLDSFTANFCHPDPLTALIGAKIMDSLSPNIQVAPGIHNLEGQYIKAAKNISSIFAGFAHNYHQKNPGLLPTILTLLTNQCLDQAAIVSTSSNELKEKSYTNNLPITELGYGVQSIEATLLINGKSKKIRDHTFSQLTAMVADVRGSLMLPTVGKPTRNFQAGEILAEYMKKLNRCPVDINEFIFWCVNSGIKEGSLEGLKSLNYWPQIKNNYQIKSHNSSLINLLYLCIFGSDTDKEIVFSVMTNSRQLSSFCHESVRPFNSKKYSEALSSLNDDYSINLIISALCPEENIDPSDHSKNTRCFTEVKFDYIKAINAIESELD